MCAFPHRKALTLPDRGSPDAADSSRGFLGVNLAVALAKVILSDIPNPRLL